MKNPQNLTFSSATYRGPEKEWKQAALTKESLQDFSEQFAQPH